MWKLGPLFIKSLVIFLKPPSFFFFSLFLTLINNTFRVSVISDVNYSKANWNLMNFYSLDHIFIPLPSNRSSTRGFSFRLYLVSFFQLYRWKAIIFTTKREKGRLSYSQLDPFFSAGQSRKYFEAYPKQFVECVSSSSSRSRDWGMNWETQVSLWNTINEITRECHRWRSQQKDNKKVANSKLSTRNKRRM